MITEFAFHDQRSGWCLERTSFASLNLLVGVSGVGKSRILDALRSTAQAGAGVAVAPRGCSWMLRVTAAADTYVWTAQTHAQEEEDGHFEVFVEPGGFVDFGRPRREARYVEERIESESGGVIAERVGEVVTFRGNPAPRLKGTESLISLFQNEAALAPLHQALSCVFVSSGAEFEFPFWPQRRVAQWRREITTLEQLRRALRVPLIARFDLLQRVDPESFKLVVESFKEIFETVVDVRVGLAKELQLETRDGEDAQILTAIVDEDGVDKPVPLGELSSGMRRTLRHLVELTLAPDGSTALIDEYENSLGVNCLPSVTEHIVGRTHALQIIATSHHPYVINSIALEHWRIVTRAGSVVTIRDAGEIPELNTSSRQDAFIRLMNSSAYRAGVGGRE